jgi:hypothetical protein
MNDLRRFIGWYVRAFIIAFTHALAFVAGIAACTGATLGVMAERGMI